MGNVSGEQYVGGLSGWYGGDNSNCYYLQTDNINASISAAGAIVSGTMTDCEAKSEAQFASGEVAWLLQAAQTEADNDGNIIQVWGQDLASDEYPVLTDNEDYRVCKVSFLADTNGSDSYEEYAAAAYANPGGTVTLPTDPAKDGYTFSGWYDAVSGGTEFTAGTTVTADVVLYAIFGVHSHKLCNDDSCTEHGDITFSKWELQDTAGNYYLATEMRINGTWTVPEGETSLCLNGHTITFEHGNIEIPSGSTLYICDCDGNEKGSIIGISSENVTVDIGSGGTLNVSSGNLINSVSNAVVNYGTLKITGGSLEGTADGKPTVYNASGGTVTISNGELKASSGNVIDNKGTATIGGGTLSSSGGYAVDNAGTLNISGSPMLSGANADIYLEWEKYITVTGEISSSCKFSVAMTKKPALENPIQITDSTNTDYNSTENFTSADDTYQVQKNSNGQLELAVIITYGVTYYLTNIDGTEYTPEDKYACYIYKTGLTLPVLSAEGFAFSGWYNNKEYTGDVVTEITATDEGDKEYWAYFKDNTDPTLTAELTPDTAKDADAWYSASDNPSITLTCSDNVGVTGLYVKIDNDGYKEINGFTENSGNCFYTDFKEGEHTYRFKAEDAAGNASESDALTVKLDTTSPVIEALTYSYKPKNLWHWLIGRKDLTITVPVTEEGSGADEITYKMTTGDGAAKENTAAISDGEAKITLNADFQGTVVITCTDKAGNISDSVTAGVELDSSGKGFLIEDQAPTIAFRVSNGVLSYGYFEETPEITVIVADDADNAISAGIETITYQIGNGEEITVEADFATEMKTVYEFTVPAGEIPTGVTVITVTAKDNAGNEAAKSTEVKVKGPESTPMAEIDYEAETLTGLEKNAEYKITVNGETATVYADEYGSIAIEESWLGSTIKLVRTGNGTDTTDSEAQEITLPARPPAPAAGTENASYPGAADGKITGLTAGTVYQISTDGGKTWTEVTADENDKIAGLAAGEYGVRSKAVEGERFRSEAVSVTVGEDSAAVYTVILHGNGGSGTELTSYTCGTGAALPTDWTKTGYTFGGWYDNADCSGTAVTAISATDAGDKNYYAGWELISYTITYNLDEGSADGNPAAYTVESESITLNNPVKTGYTFTGWSGTDLTGDTNMSVTIAAGSTGSREYTAHWKKNSTGRNTDGSNDTDSSGNSTDNPNNTDNSDNDTDSTGSNTDNPDNTADTDNADSTDTGKQPEDKKGPTDGGSDKTEDTKQEDAGTPEQAEPSEDNLVPEAEPVQTGDASSGKAVIFTIMIITDIAITAIVLRKKKRKHSN